MSKKLLLFVSYASEDSAFAEELASALKAEGAEVWFAPWSIRIGDSFPRQIDNGLARADYAVVILSKQYFQKNWTRKELDALLVKESFGKKVILPVRFGIEAGDIAASSLLLSTTHSFVAGDDTVRLARELLKGIATQEEVVAAKVQEVFPIATRETEASKRSVPLAIDIGSHGLRLAVADPLPRCIRFGSRAKLVVPQLCRFGDKDDCFPLPLIRLLGATHGSEVVTRTLAPRVSSGELEEMAAYDFLTSSYGRPFPSPRDWFRADNDGRVRIRCGKRTMFPHEIVHKVFQMIRREASDSVKSEVDRAVICIPFDLDPGQKLMIQQLAVAAGFSEIRMIGTGAGACALSMLWPPKEGIEESVVVNCGEDRTSITRAEFYDGFVQVKQYEAVSSLCGARLTSVVDEMLLERLTEFQVGDVVPQGERFRLALKIKEELSYKQEVDVRVPGHPARLQLNQHEFRRRAERHVENDFWKIGETVRNTNPDRTTYVLVGGQGKCPMVQSRLMKVANVRIRMPFEGDAADVLGASCIARSIFRH